jgi:CheY-like chemotaxis protein
MPGKQILFIDGDDTFIQDVAAAAEHQGYRALISRSSTEGVETARTERPDLVVVSVELSPTNGWSVCTRLKKDDELKDIPIILTSATSTPDTFEKHKKLRTRADEYLLKPYAADELLRVAGHLLGVPEPVSEEDMIVEGDESLLGRDFDVAGMDEEIRIPADEPFVNGHGVDEKLGSLESGDDGLVDETLGSLASEGSSDQDQGDYAGSAFQREDEQAASLEAGAEDEFASEPQEGEQAVDEEDILREVPASGELTAGSSLNLGDDLNLQLTSEAAPAGEQPYADQRETTAATSSFLTSTDSTSEEEAVLAAFDRRSPEATGAPRLTNGILPGAEENTFGRVSADEAPAETAPAADVVADPLAGVASLPGEYVVEVPSLSPREATEAVVAPPSPPSRAPMRAEESRRVAELEARVASLEAEIEGFRATESSHDQEMERLRAESRGKSDEMQMLRDQLHEKERIIRGMKELESQAAVEAAKVKDERVRREAAMKALTQKAEQMSAQANRLENDLAAMQEEAANAATLKTKLTELEQALEDTRRTASTEREENGKLRQQLETRIGELEKAVEHARSTAAAETAALQQQVEQGVRDLDRVRAAHGQAVIDLESARSDHESARVQLEETRRVADQHGAALAEMKEKLAAAEQQVQALTTQTQSALDLAGRARAQLLKLAEELTPRLS